MPSRSALYRQEAHGVFSLQLYGKSPCRSIVDQVLRVDQWNAAEVGGEGATAVDTAIRAAGIAKRGKTAAIHNDFEQKIAQIVRPCLRRMWGRDLARCEGTQLIRYGPGGHYNPHKDGDDDGYASRYFTVLCYLNDNFQGGKTRFPSLGYSATPVTGRALIFPARFVHGGEPVLSGEKLVFLAWLCGPPPLLWI
jgi:prolyl 4-hydroxylase